MSCGGSMKKMQLGGLANLIKKTVKKITRPKPKTPKLQSGGLMKKMQYGGITKNGQKINFPPIPKKNRIKEIESVKPTKLSAFEKRQQNRIERAKTRSQIASIEGEGTVSQKRNNRASRISKVLGTDRPISPKSISTSTTEPKFDSNNSNSGNTSNTNPSKSNSSVQRKQIESTNMRKKNKPNKLKKGGTTSKIKLYKAQKGGSY